MGEKEWTPEREAAVLAAAEKGFDVSQFGPPVANPLRKVGRPSLSASGGTSKTLNTRIPAELHRKITALADDEGRSVSDLTRDALDALVAKGRATDVRAGTPAARNQSELVEVVARRLGGRAAAADAVEAVLASILAAVAEGGEIVIGDFGTFERAEEGPRVRVRPPQRESGSAGAERAGRKTAEGVGRARGARKSASQGAPAKATASPPEPKKAKTRKAG